MTSHRHIVSLAALAAGFVSILFAPACIIDDSDLSEPNLYFCVADSDCPVSRFECNTTTNTCEIAGIVDSVCVDNDKDGYGIGDDRTECRFPEEDTDDTDADIFPNAPDVCDTKDNDSDGQTDEPLSCDGASDCPQTGVPNGSFFRCESNLCTLKPANTIPDGCNVVLGCVDGAYQEVPAQCQ